MKKDYMHICVILDASGSMDTIKRDTKGSMNSFIETQKEEKGKTVFELYQFNDKVEHIVAPVDLAHLDTNLMDKYKCGGCTAMNDAICIAIDELGQEFAAMPESERPENVLVVILTDGQENSSKRFDSNDVKKRIEHQQKIYNWAFLFLAANQDACVSGKKIGVNYDCCSSFKANSEGMQFSERRMYQACLEIRKRSLKKDN